MFYAPAPNLDYSWTNRNPQRQRGRRQSSPSLTLRVTVRQTSS